MAIGSILTMVLPMAVLIIPGTALFALLQWLLCRLDSPWPGRILPICSGAFSLLPPLLILFNMVGNPARAVLSVLLLLVVFNLPTLVYLLIYRAMRRGKVRRQDMDRMNIQDL